MINSISILNILSLLFLTGCIFILLFSGSKKGYNKFILGVSVVILILSELTNLLEHTNITIKYDTLENFIELLFFPVFIFSFFTSVITKELNKRIISEKKFSAIFNQASTYVGLLDKTGVLIEANESALTLINAKPEDVIGKKLWDTPWWTHSNKERNKLVNAFEKALKGHMVKLEATHRSYSGKLEYVDFSLTPIYNSNNDIEFLIPEGRNITHIKETKEQLRILLAELEDKNVKLNVALERAKESDKLKSTFINNISHEVRTPLNGIMGFIEILKTSSKKPEDIGRYLDIIYKSSYRLFIIIEDILDFSVIINKEMKVIHRNTAINESLHDLYNKYEGLINNTIDFKIVLSENNNILIFDDFKFRKVFTKLIDNAIKYTSSGEIQFGVFKEKNDENIVTCFVSDTGRGISKNMLNKIFDPFVQEDLGNNYLNDGNGLGLTISKKIIELMKGTISVSSEINKGSTFYFTLPVGIPINQ